MAQFILDRFDGNNPPIEVDHSVTLKQSGLTWVGQYYSGFGEVLLENMLHLSENFAGPVPPYSIDDPSASYNALEGQVWYHTTDVDNFNNKILKIQDGNTQPGTDGWKRIELILSDTEPTTYAEGESWYDINLKTISIARDNRWEDLKVKVAYDTEKVKGVDGDNFLRKDIDDTMLGNLYATNIFPITHSTYDLGSNTSRWRSLYVNELLAAYSHDLVPVADLTENLGSETRRWANLFVDTVDANSFTDIIPEIDATYIVGDFGDRWLRIHAVSGYFDNLDSVMPRTTSSNVGSNTSRWNNGYFNNINANLVSSNLTPLNPNQDLGQLASPWDNLYVNVIHSATTGTFEPIDNATNIGTSSNPYNTLYVTKFGNEVSFEGDISFDIIQNDRSNGVKWTGLNDIHEIYAEEYSNSENTRLVFESGTNTQDYAVFRNNGVDILEIKRDSIEAYKDINAHEKVTVLGPGGVGVSIEYNEDLEAMEFRFF